MSQFAARHSYLDPPSAAYYGGRLFDMENPALNRDDALRPFFRLRELLREKGHQLDTADVLLAGLEAAESGDYYSLGITANFERLAGRPGVQLRAFAIYEPPVVSPELYRRLPELTRYFERVYVHNTHGDGYSLVGVDQSKLRKLYFFQPFDHVLETHWSRTDRLNKLVVINANKRPKSKSKELYSKRIEAIAKLAKWQAVDLYGPGWDRVWLKIGRFRYVLYGPALRHHRALVTVNQGPCASKYETLSRYRFCLCFENMVMDGYITEKLIDCLYAGTIPVYWGAPDITDFIPSDCFIDFRQFPSYDALWQHLSQLDEATLTAYREAGRRFIESPAFAPFYEALPRLMEDQ